MDFLPHMVNNDRTNVFINKAKKQAKRLYKLSQKNDNQLNIDNLAQAQDILAQLNGYEDWHAMIQSIQTAQIKQNLTLPKPYQYLTIKNQDQFELMQETNDENILDFSTKYPYLVGTEYLYSFINIDIYRGHNEEILKSYDFNESLIYLLGVLQYYGKNPKEDSSFQLIIEKKELETNLTAWQQQVDLAQKCGIELNLAKSLFMVEYPTKTKEALHVCLVVKTPLNQKTKHYKNVSRLLLDHYGYLQTNIKSTISPLIMDIVKNQSPREYNQTTVPTKGITGLFKADDINDHIELVSYLNEHCHDWAGTIDLTKKSFSIFHHLSNKDNINNALSNIKNIKNIKKSNVDSFKIKLAKPTSSKGIPFVQVTTQQTDCIDFQSINYRGHNSIFIGNNEHNHVLSNYINYIRTLEHLEKHNYLHDGFYVSLGTQEPLYNLLVTTLNPELQDNLHYINMDEGKYYINLFDTKLGIKDLNQESFYANPVLMKILYGDKYLKKISREQLHELYVATRTLVEDLYTFNEQNPKMYEYGINKKIDQILNNIHSNDSWFELSAYYMNQSQPLLSQICHYQAMPTLEDLDVLIRANKEKYSTIFSKISNIDSISKNLQQFMIENPLLNKPTNIYIESKNLYFFDLDGIDNSLIILNLLTNHFVEYRKRIEAYCYSDNMQESFKDYYKQVNLNNEYFLSLSHDTFTDNDDNNIILWALRESRKWNIGMQIIAYDAHENLLNYSHMQFFTSSINNKNFNHEAIVPSQTLKPNEFLIYAYSPQIGHLKNHYKFIINDNFYRMLTPD